MFEIAWKISSRCIVNAETPNLLFEIAQSSRKRMLEIAGLKKAACKNAAEIVLTELVDSDDKKPRLGKTREWIKKRRETGYLRNIFQELKFEDWMGFQDMFDYWMSLSLSLSLLYCKTENWMNTITSSCF